MRIQRRYLPPTQHAVMVLGAEIAIARRRLGWTATELGERLGVSAELVSRIERGAVTTAVGTVFEAAVVCGVPLFTADPVDLPDMLHRQQATLALLPARVRRHHEDVSDDF